MTDQGTAMPPEPIQEAWGLFCGPIDQNTVRSFMLNLAVATQKKIRRVHLLFQSSGGTVTDGVALYRLFKGFPGDLALYNAGGVYSIACIAFLGARRRVTSAHAIFMIHKTRSPDGPFTAESLKHIREGVVRDDARTEAILREHLTLAQDVWEALHHNNLFFSGEEALEVGFANEIGEFSPPKGAELFCI